MAHAPVNVTGSNANTPSIGTVFNGISFFLVQRVPSRSRFVNDIEANGGRVVKLEAQADYVIADQARKDAPAGSISYEFITAALNTGQLPDPAEHEIRPKGAVREVGSTVMGRSTRTPFTVDDDKLLWNWVKNAEATGGAIKGLEIYKKLEAVNPRHTCQSWRDRYVKILSNRPPTGISVPANPPPSPPVTGPGEQQPAEEVVEEVAEDPVEEVVEFVPEPGDIEKLMENVEDIEMIPPEKWLLAWEAFAEAQKTYTAKQWMWLYTNRVQPVYRMRLMREAAARDEQFKAEQDAPSGQEAESAGVKRKFDESQPHVGEEQIKRPRVAAPEMNGSPLRNNSRPSQRRESPNAMLSEEASGPDHGDEDGEEGIGASARRDVDPTLSEPPLITSDLITAANVQLRGEAGMNSTDPPRPSQTEEEQNTHLQMLRSEAEMPTSDANRAADAQFGDWRADGDDAGQGTVDVEQNHVLPLSDEAAQHPANETQHALTAANLASQQAQHEPPTIRGKDLQRDDDDKDQTDYAKYLQAALGVDDGAQKEGHPSKQDGESDESSEYSSRATPSSRVDANVPAYPPLSSPREIEETLEDAMNWPASPQQRRKRGIDVEEPLYPQLPKQSEHDGTLNDNFDLPANVLMSQLNEATDRRGSDSQTHETGEGFPSFEELMNGENVDTDDDYHETDHNGDIEDDDDGYNPNEDGDDIDLTVAEPDGGFELPSSPYENGKQRDDMPDDNAKLRSQSIISISSHHSSSSLSEDAVEQTARSNRGTNGGRRHIVETQDILNAETQQPDLEMPLPFDDLEDDFEDYASHHSQEQPARDKGKEKAVEAASLDTADDVFSWVSKMKVRGFKQAAVVKALKRSSNRPDLALLVLLDGKAGKGLPNDVPGIWSEIEDEVLESGDAQGMSELNEKHGWPEMEARLKFLEDWRGLR